MTVFASKEAFKSLGLEQIKQSHALASQDCSICTHPLAVHPTSSKDPHSQLHTAVRIAACGHIVGEACLDAWLDVGHTCPKCNSLLFEATGDPITQQDIDNLLRMFDPMCGENAVMAVVGRLMVRQEQEHARVRQAHEIELERMKAKEKEARNDGFTLSDDDFLDSDEELDFGEDEDDKGVFEMDENAQDSAE
jgi:hypothetical protein